MAEEKDEDLELDNLLWELNDIAGRADLDQDEEEDDDDDDDFDNFNFLEGEELTGFPISPSQNEDTVLSSPVKKKPVKKNTERTKKRKSQFQKDQARTRRKSKDPLENLRKPKPIERKPRPSYELFDEDREEFPIESNEVPKSSSPWLDSLPKPPTVDTMPVSSPVNTYTYSSSTHPQLELDEFQINHVPSSNNMQPKKWNKDRIVRMPQRIDEKTPVKTKKLKSMRPKTAPTKTKHRTQRSKSFQTPSPKPSMSYSSSSPGKTKRRRTRGRVNSYCRSNSHEVTSYNKRSEVRPYSDCGPSFGTARNARMGKVEKSSAPGPGHYYKYTGFCTQHQSPGSTFGASNRFGRKYARSANNSPGPGHYTAARPRKQLGGQSFSLSKSKRFQKKQEKRPAPGQYSDRLFRRNNPKSGGHSFSRCARMPVKRRSNSPGPGSYSTSTHMLNHDRLFVTFRKSTK